MERVDQPTQEEVLDALLETWGDPLEEEISERVMREEGGRATMLGVGTQGLAYALCDGTVVKVTDTVSEASVAVLASEYGWPAFPWIETVRSFTLGDTALYAIYREGVDDFLSSDDVRLKDLVDKAFEGVTETSPPCYDGMKRLRAASSELHREVKHLLAMLDQLFDETGVRILDLHCENIGRTRDGRVVVRDFGLNALSPAASRRAEVLLAKEREEEESCRASDTTGYPTLSSCK